MKLATCFGGEEELSVIEIHDILEGEFMNFKTLCFVGNILGFVLLACCVLHGLLVWLCLRLLMFRVVLCGLHS